MSHHKRPAPVPEPQEPHRLRERAGSLERVLREGKPAALAEPAADVIRDLLSWVQTLEQERSTLIARFAEQDWQSIATAQDGLLHPAHQVFFRAGLLACREYMARFVEAESPTIAMSIRANWWPSLGPDFGQPRKLDFGEVTTGEFGTPDFRIKTTEEVSPTQEALPIALNFLDTMALPAPPRPEERRTSATGSRCRAFTGDTLMADARPPGPAPQEPAT